MWLRQVYSLTLALQKLVTTVLAAQDVASHYAETKAQAIGGSPHSHLARDELDETWHVVSHSLQQLEGSTRLLSMIAEQC